MRVEAINSIRPQSRSRAEASDEKDIVEARPSESSSLNHDGHGDHDRERIHLKGEKDSEGLAPVKSLHQVLSRRSTRASRIDPGPPPDGGTKAWLQGMSTIY